MSIAAVALSALGESEAVAAILGAVEDRRAVASALSVLSPPELDALTEQCRDLLGVETFERLHARRAAPAVRRRSWTVSAAPWNA